MSVKTKLTFFILAAFMLSTPSFSQEPQSQKEGGGEQDSASPQQGGTSRYSDVGIPLPEMTRQCPECESFVDGQWKCFTRAEKPVGVPTGCWPEKK